MKKILLVIISILIVAAGIACAVTLNSKEQNQGGLMDKTDKKILVAYFSWGGNTKSIAEKFTNKSAVRCFQLNL